MDGITLPFSRRTPLPCVLFMRSATCCCVRPESLARLDERGNQREFVFEGVICFLTVGLLTGLGNHFIGRNEPHMLVRDGVARKVGAAAGGLDN